MSAPVAAQNPGQPRPAAVKPEKGWIDKGVYHNPFFGLECEIPAGWVLQPAELDSGQNLAGSKLVLLSAFARTPHSAGPGINSAILLAAEGQKSADMEAESPLEYLVAVKRAAHQSGLELTNPPRELRVGAHSLWRADFESEAEDTGISSRYQITEVNLERGYFLSFTVVAASQALAEALLPNLRFVTPRQSPRAKPR
jgi:hypothetical protein